MTARDLSTTCSRATRSGYAARHEQPLGPAALGRRRRHRNNPPPRARVVAPGGASAAVPPAVPRVDAGGGDDGHHRAGNGAAAGRSGSVGGGSPRGGGRRGGGGGRGRGREVGAASRDGERGRGGGRGRSRGRGGGGGRGRGRRRHERNNGEAGLTRFNRSLAAWNAAHGTNYHSSNLCPCPVENCLFFGLSKQLFKLKQTRPEYDLARVPVANLPPPSAEGNPNPPPLPVDFSEAAWSIRGNSSALFMTLSRHFTFNLLPGNRELVTGDVQDAHMANVPECLRSLCKRSNDKTFRTLQTLLGIDPPGYDEDEDEDDDDDVDNDGNN